MTHDLVTALNIDKICKELKTESKKSISLYFNGINKYTYTANFSKQEGKL